MPLEHGVVVDGVPMPWLHDAPRVAIIDPEASGKRLGKKKFVFLSVSKMFESYEPVQWLIDGFIQDHALALVFGESTGGKSFAVIDWACSVATGKPWNGAEVVGGPVFYIAGEGHNGFCRRVRAWEIMNSTSTDGVPLYFSERPAALMNPESAKEVIEAVKELIEANGKPAMIIIDTLHRNFGGGDENSAADFGLFLNHIDVMRAELGAAVIIVHHSGHGAAGRSRGSSSIKAAMDHEYCLTIETDKRRLMTCTKMKDAAEPAPIYFHLRGVEIDLLDAKGRADNSAVLVKDVDQAATAESKAKTTSKPLDYVREAIKSCGSNQQEVVRQKFYDLYPGSDAAKQKAFRRGWGLYMFLATSVVS